MKTPNKIFISTSTFSKYSQEPLAILRHAGYSPELNPFGRRLTQAEVVDGLQQAIGLIAATEPLDERVFAAAPSLRAISRVGSGLDSVDLKAARRRGIEVMRTESAPVEAVAELTLALMLNVLRKVTATDRALRAGIWKSQMGNLLYGKKIAIIGLGRIGRRLVELLRPFHADICAVDPYPDTTFMRRNKIKRVSLQAALRRSDIISLHMVLDSKTRRLIGGRQLKQMKPTAILINTARGELIDDRALASALAGGRLGGAGLDVFDPEPYKGPLVKCPTAVLTCHMGTYAEETRNLMEIQAARNIVHALRRNK